MGIPGQLGQFFTHAATGFAVTGRSGNVVHANRAFALIVDRESQDIADLNVFDMTHPEDRARNVQLLDQLLTAKIPGYVIEKRFVRRDGSSIWVRNSVSLVTDGNPAAGHLVHICENIGDRKRIEQILERQEQMAALGRLTSSIMHEINNPLEAVFNLIYLAQQTANPDQAGHYLKMAEEELGRVAEITMQGLHFHRQSSVAMLANLSAVLQTVVVLFGGRFRRSQVRVAMALEKSADLLCFAGEIRQVFVNLIGNAVESMPQGGRLILRVKPVTDWRTDSRGVRVTVADTGAGMSQETRQRLFEAFYTTKGENGSGLGLWVSANILRKHNASIQVRSNHRGTVFSLLFPYNGVETRNAGVSDAA